VGGEVGADEVITYLHTLRLYPNITIQMTDEVEVVDLGAEVMIGARNDHLRSQKVQVRDCGRWSSSLQRKR
jgi:hypothetical protein